MKAYLEATRQLYQPNIDAMRNSLPDLGESLLSAAVDLSRELSLDRLDRLAAQLNSALTNLQHLRKAIIAERGGVMRGGTG